MQFRRKSRAQCKSTRPQQVICDRLSVFLYLTLPDPHDGPTKPFGYVGRSGVTLGILLHLGGPDFRVGPAPRRHTPVLRASVPEAAVNEDSDVAGWQDEVRCAALRDLGVEPEPALHR